MAKTAIQSALKVGDPAPEFEAASDDGSTIRLRDLRGKKIVLYFYPKDDTPGCTKEACAFRDGIDALTDKGAVVLGVSIDSAASHQRFREKYRLNFPLLSDPDRRIAEAYGVWKKKSLYGRTFLGIVRTTFVIDARGRIARIFPNVKVDQHYEAVLAALG